MPAILDDFDDYDFDAIATDLQGHLREMILAEDEKGEGEPITLRLSPVVAFTMFSCTLAGIAHSTTPITREAFAPWLKLFHGFLPKFPDAMQHALCRIIVATYEKLFPEDSQEPNEE